MKIEKKRIDQAVIWIAEMMAKVDLARRAATADCELELLEEDLTRLRIIMGIILEAGL
jgi:hypothetical protein